MALSQRWQAGSEEPKHATVTYNSMIVSYYDVEAGTNVILLRGTAFGHEFLISTGSKFSFAFDEVVPLETT